MDESDSPYYCWRCNLRTNKVKFGDDNSLCGNSCKDKDFNTYIGENIINEKCSLCSDLLLIDNHRIFYIEKVPNEVLKTKRRRFNKRSTVACGRDDQPLNTGFTFHIYKKKNMNNIKNKNYSHSHTADNGIYIKDIFTLILNEAVNGDSMYKIKDFGISIELSSELRENKEISSNNTLKSCLRQLLINQTNNVVLNQESDLFINFSFSTKIPNNQIDNNTNSDFKDYSNLIFRISVNFKWKNVYMTGRYIKLSRRISQSKWSHKDDNVIVDTSIEELLENSLLGMVKFSNITFSSSGREDIDVRMLGIDISRNFKGDSLVYDEGNKLGRPFAVEISGISDNYHLFYSNVELYNSNNCEKSYYRSIKDFTDEYTKNVKLLSKSRVILSSLEITDIFTVNKMNKQVSEKEKSYVCVCYSPTSLSNRDYQILSDRMLNIPVSISQRTPIRVLHRRVNMDRVRHIVIVKIVEINQNYFILYLKTQAGTYIKEFIHGDFGRTNPSFGDLIVKYLPKEKDHKLEVSIVQLDVLNVI
ncbi:hypothetical protein FG386_001003 [Cryptosporidium ryanae]|uniref:uncharacterized protein n=1 Tax=Cryptosporidium ryanae TaxID=515981 RepID=UPI00351A0E7A|nr:hypothetical protein FG386_001003 [Cryptosporidium ryanae]